MVRFGESGKWRFFSRANIPYFVSAQLAQDPNKNLLKNEPSDFFAGLFGAFLHVATWIALVAMDLQMWLFHYREANGTTAYWTQFLCECASGSLIVTAAVVILCSIVHFFNLFGINFNDGLLPPVITSLILGGARSTLYFSQILFLCLLLNGGLATEPSWELKYVAATVFLKFLGVSMTVNNNRFKIYDDQDKPHFVAAS